MEDDDEEMEETEEDEENEENDEDDDERENEVALDELLASFLHAAEHPSPLFLFPSSHSSGPTLSASPQTGEQMSGAGAAGNDAVDAEDGPIEEACTDDNEETEEACDVVNPWQAPLLQPPNAQLPVARMGTSPLQPNS